MIERATLRANELGENCGRPRGRRRHELDRSNDRGEGKPARKKASQILDAAARLVLEQGYDASSMEAIARAAPVSKSTLYAHYESKDALFVALVEHECRLLASRICVPDIDKVDLVPALRQIARNFIALFLDGRGVAMYRIIMAEVARFPKLANVFLENGPHLIRDRVAQFLRQAAERDILIIPDPKLAAVQFISLVRGDLPMERSLSITRPSFQEMDKVVDSAINLFLAGYSNGHASRATRSGLDAKPNR